jgi:hypothetical protein
MKLKLTHIGLSLLAGTAALVCAVSPAQAADKKPNIILIVSDDFGYGDAGPYGGGIGRGMPTPSLDRMADEGMTFFSFYVMKTFLQYPPRKIQSETYSGPITISSFQKFSWLREELQKEGVHLTLPSGN